MISLSLIGCKGTEDNIIKDKIEITSTPVQSITPTESASQDAEVSVEEEYGKEETEISPTILAVDYSNYFDGMEGTAVIYNPETKVYQVYNKELSEKRSSPCSTFKIISTIMGLESGIISSVNSTMGYDGTQYGVDTWNKDITLSEAFQSSCIWYYRKVIDQIGDTEVQAYVDELGYGNCDINEWLGSGINPSPELNGFWLESSLEITPMEQVEVLSDIFEGKTKFSKDNIAILKEIMLVQESDDETIYGKTGTGKNLSKGNQNNGWFVGMFETLGNRYYIAIHLVDENQEVTGNNAKAIALKMINEF